MWIIADYKSPGTGLFPLLSTVFFYQAGLKKLGPRSGPGVKIRIRSHDACTGIIICGTTNETTMRNCIESKICCQKAIGISRIKSHKAIGTDRPPLYKHSSKKQKGKGRLKTALYLSSLYNAESSVPPAAR